MRDLVHVYNALHEGNPGGLPLTSHASEPDASSSPPYISCLRARCLLLAHASEPDASSSLLPCLSTEYSLPHPHSAPFLPGEFVEAVARDQRSFSADVFLRGKAATAHHMYSSVHSDKPLVAGSAILQKHMNIVSAEVCSDSMQQ